MSVSGRVPSQVQRAPAPLEGLDAQRVPGAAEPPSDPRLDLSRFSFTKIQDREFVVYRGQSEVGSDRILLAVTASPLNDPAVLTRFEHTYALRDVLDGSFAVHPLRVLRYQGRAALITEDPGGDFLIDSIGKLGLTEFLRVALGISKALRSFHAQGLIHRDIKPNFILVERASGRAWLTGTGHSLRAPRHRQLPQPPDVLAGTLAYMAPEQTGRMNRSIDSRSDLYALGVTLYELLTGQLPFVSSDPLEIVHSHIARLPRAPIEHVPELPAVVSAIVLKLLAKNAEDRYQTAAGLEADLRTCASQLQADDRIVDFDLGRHDASNRLLVPEKLYGREAETAALLDAFDEVLKLGASRLAVVSGYSGVGKSSVINEVHKVLVPPRALFASGKFDQYQRDTPYATLAQAFHGLVRWVLSLADADLAAWRAALVDALGANGQLIVNLVPELGAVLGPQPPVPELPPLDTQERFQRTVERFMMVFARPEHPLVLFLDDLQWLDPASLQLLAFILTESDLRHLLLIGAYRDNEVLPDHPLAQTLATLRGRTAMREIVLAPLGTRDVTAMVADTLRCSLETATPLAELLHEKTAGNPFFIIQFLSALAEERLLDFDPSQQAWRWDVTRIRAKGYTDNVVSLLEAKLGRLPGPARAVLQDLACLGSTATLAELALVRDQMPELVEADVSDAIGAGLVVRSNDVFSLLHDRVQEAAYASIPHVEKRAAHLRIGRRLAAHYEGSSLEQRIFDIVSHLNLGVESIDSAEERARVVELNLLAAKRAQSSTAYGSALVYLDAARLLLEKSDFEGQPRLSFQVDFQRAECALLTGDLAHAERLLDVLGERTQSTEDRAAVTGLRMMLHTLLDRSDFTVDICLDYLREVGIEWTRRPSRARVEAELAQVWQGLGERPISALFDLPRLVDADRCATMNVLVMLQVGTMFTDPDLNDLVVCRLVNLSLADGNCDASTYAYVLFGLLLGPHFGDYRAGFEFGQLALRLVDHAGFSRFRARILMCFGNMVVPWTRPARDGRSLVRRALRSAQEAGDLAFAMYSFHNIVANMLFCGDVLDSVQQEGEVALEYARKARLTHGLDLLIPQIRLGKALRGLLPELGSFDDADFDEGAYEQHLRNNPSLSMAACFYWIRKLQLRYFAGDYEAALAAAADAESMLWVVPYFLEFADYHSFAGLAHAALCTRAGPDVAAPDEPHLRALAAHAAALTALSANSPENFSSQAALLRAELARLGGRPLDAMRLYDEAALAARHQGFVHSEALALERAALFYEREGLKLAAQEFLRNARRCYASWGAAGKVRQLDQLHGSVVETPTPLSTTNAAGALEQLDLATVMQMAQAISGEIVLEKLVPKLMEMALKHAGAGRGVLIRTIDPRPLIEAEVRTEGDALVVHLPSTAPLPEDLPLGILNYVSRTLTEVTLDDATQSNPFADDRYFTHSTVRSVLCLPLLKQAKLMGVLYMENALTPHAFTAARIALLKVLASQAAISLENAALYGELRREHHERSEAEHKRLKSEALLEEAQRLGNTGSFRWNLETGEMAWSNELFRIAGIDRTHVPSQQLLLAHVPPDDQLVVLDAIDRATSERTTVEYEHRFVKGGAPGSTRHLRGIARTVVNENGQDEFIGSLMDVTDRKVAEDSLNQMRAELAYVSRIVTMSTVAASIAHEVNQPLAGITMNASACLRYLALTPPDLEEVQSAAQRLVRDSLRAGDVIARLRSLYKRTDTNKAALDLNAVVREAVALTRSELHEHAVVLRLVLARDLPAVVGDHVQLQQVLVNLIINAIEAMSTVTERPRALVITTAAKDSVTARVEDSGTGFDVAAAGRLFDAFYTSKTGGMGIGLSITRNIVESHGGQISAERNDEHGATFQFSLPIAAVAVA